MKVTLRCVLTFVTSIWIADYLTPFIPCCIIPLLSPTPPPPLPLSLSYFLICLLSLQLFCLIFYYKVKISFILYCLFRCFFPFPVLACFTPFPFLRYWPRLLRSRRREGSRQQISFSAPAQASASFPMTSFKQTRSFRTWIRTIAKPKLFNFFFSPSRSFGRKIPGSNPIDFLCREDQCSTERKPNLPSYDPPDRWLISN